MPEETPFTLAEDYIQLRRKCVPASWMDTAMQCNELLLAPVVLLFLFFTGSLDVIMALSSLSKLYESWSEWCRFEHLRFVVQDMFLTTMSAGGPFIRTNDPEYMPYVFADAVMRVAQRRSGSETRH